MLKVATTPGPMPHARRAKMRLPEVATKTAIYSVLILNALLMIFPLVWMVSTSLKLPGKQLVFPPQFIPDPVVFDNFVELFTRAPMWTYLYNSVKISVLSTIGISLSSALAAFAFARMRFRGKEILFTILLATLMIPGQVTIIPTFTIMKSLNWINTQNPLIVPNFFGGAFQVFLLRQFYRTIPQDLIDAAKMDGAGFLRIFWTIFIPLGMPALATVAVLSFLGAWNDLFTPLIFLNSQDQMPVSLGLMYLRGRAGTTGGRMGVLMGGALIGTLPMLLLYFAGQKYFVQGLARTGIKG